MLLAASGFNETGSSVLEEIAGHLELRAERLSQGSSNPQGSGLDFNPWMGVRPLADLLKSLRETRADQVGHPAAPIVGRICRAIMTQVVVLDEEQLENEGLEVRRRVDRCMYAPWFALLRRVRWGPGCEVADGME